MFYRRRVVLVNDGLSTKEFGVIAQVVARLLFFQRLREFITYLDMNPCRIQLIEQAARSEI